MKNLLISFLLFFIFFCRSASQDKFKSKGITDFFKKNYKSCVENLNEFIIHKSNDSEAYYYRALCKLYMNEFDEAIQDFTKAIDLGFNKPDAYNNRGLAFLYNGDFKLALDDFNSAIGKDSNFAEAYTNRATVNIEIGEFDDALLDLRKSIEINPNNISTYYEMGRVFYKKKDYQEAIVNFDKCIKLGLRNSKVYYNRGNSYFKLGNFKKAIEDYTKCISLDSNDTEALNNRAVAYENLGLHEKAKEDRKRIAKILGNENLFKPIEEVEFIELTDSLQCFKLSVPSHWMVIQNSDTNKSEIIITPENISSFNDFYSIGIKIAFIPNISVEYSVHTPGEILEFWRGSIEKNAQDYYYYKYLQQKLFTRGDYTGNLFETIVQYWQNSFLFQCYELALAKEDTLLYGFFQAPSNQFSYFRQIFDKVLSSLTPLK